MPNTYATIAIANDKTSAQRTFSIAYVTPDKLSNAANGVLASLDHPDIREADGDHLKDINCVLRVTLHDDNAAEIDSAQFGGICGVSFATALENSTLPNSAAIDHDIAGAEKLGDKLVEYYTTDFKFLTGTDADVRPPAVTVKPVKKRRKVVAKKPAKKKAVAKGKKSPAKKKRLARA